MTLFDNKRTNAALIASCLQKQTTRKLTWHLRCKSVCASTEVSLANWINTQPLSNDLPRAIFAARQTNAIGQRGRAWISPKGGVWMSAALPYFSGNQSSGLFGLAVAFSLCERLEMIGVPVKIKWPNDLFVFDRKLVGFLPKLIYRGDSIRQARIGIGLNVFNKVPENGISLIEILGSKNLDLAKWSVEVLLALERAIDLCEKEDPFYLAAEKRLWNDKVIDSESGEIWLIDGLNNNGELKLIRGKRKMVWNRWE